MSTASALARPSAAEDPVDTLIKSIRLTGDAQEIDCRYEGIKGLVLRAEFVKKR